MRYKKPARMRRIRINMEDVGRRERLGWTLLVPATMPFAANPGDVGQMASLGERLQDRVLGAFTVELQEVDLGEAELVEVST